MGRRGLGGNGLKRGEIQCRFRPGTHHGLLLLRLGSPGRQTLLERITHLFGTEETDRWNGCFIVVSDRKIRIQRPDQH